MKIKLSFILSFLFIAQIYGQNAQLCGTVVQDENDYLIPSTAIYLISKTNDTVSSESNYNGKYIFENLEKGEYRLRTLSNYDTSRMILDTVVTLLDSVNYIDLRLKMFRPYVFEKNSFFEFKYAEVPTSTFNFEYIIKKDSIFLNQTLKVPIDGSDYSRLRAEHSNYVYVLKPKEKMTIENLVKSYNLLLVSSYERRMLVWGWHWKISFDYQSITYNIDLPNYHNQGLEELINYVTSLIPKSKKKRWTR